MNTVDHEFLNSGDGSNLPLIMRVANLLTCGLILGTNVPLIIFFLNQGSKTFLDWLVVLDCFLCVCNPILLLIRFEDYWRSICGYVFFSFFTSICNSQLTLGIALYRAILVFGSSFVWTSYQRKMIEKLILLMILTISVLLTGWAVSFRENYKYFLGNSFFKKNL